MKFKYHGNDLLDLSSVPGLKAGLLIRVRDEVGLVAKKYTSAQAMRKSGFYCWISNKAGDCTTELQLRAHVCIPYCKYRLADAVRRCRCVNFEEREDVQ